MTERPWENPAHPAWIREIDHTLPVKPQFLVTGNIRDTHLIADRPGLVPTVDVLRDCLRDNGYEIILRFDPIDGLQLLHESTPGAAHAVYSGLTSERPVPLTLTALTTLLKTVVRHAGAQVALLIDFGSRLSPNTTDAELHGLLAAADKLATSAETQGGSTARRAPLFNSIIWLMDRELDLPHWLSASDGVRVVSIPVPTLDSRTLAAARAIDIVPGYRDLDEVAQNAVVERFGRLTHGMSLRSISEIAVLAVDGGVPVDRIDDAVRAYRVGIVDNPWRQTELREAIRGGQETLGSAVLGQEPAIRKALDILTRSTLGLTGAHSGGHASRPQGILFLAGPTGVGKTELAKSLARLLFGTEDAYTRFDMSEFSAEQSEARLIGAPPGYIGHDAGGELTNAVRQRPFSILLFDEVEKAHPRILDKFLQILEDGRLTDGSGSTVYFSESVIVFTSNLGIYRTLENGEREPIVRPGEQTYDELVTRVRDAIDKDFTSRIGRPELLNRIGDNIVVFDFIDRPTGARLVTKYLDNIVSRVGRELEIELSLGPGVRDQLEELALDERSLAFGGRGIGATIESVFTNPLARALFDLPDGATQATVTGLRRDDGFWSVELR